MALIVVAMLIAPCSFADDGKKPPEGAPDYSEQLRRIPPTPSDQAAGTFRIVPGFEAQIVAAEPLLASPVAMAIDEDGRLFVVEMRDYSEHPDKNLGRIRLLEDDDNDGVYERSTVFADKLSWPTAIICSRGGVFVGAAPDLLYLKDTDGDGRADERKVIYTGFGRQNVQGMFNSFLYGLDGRIHVAASSNGGTIRRPDDPAFKPVELRGRDFAFDPITLALEPISGGAQHGAAFDDFGRRFLCHNSDHLQMVMYEDRYAIGSKAAAPPAKQSIAADGPQAEVYRISPVEAWRDLRTKLRVAGQVPGPVEGGGRAAGYFTSATGITVYRGDAWPAEHRGTVFVADVGSNIIHRKKLTPSGVGFTGTRIDEGVEFLASTDNWFRPVQMANAPDGCLWVIDMYREVIEHPASIPPMIKKHIDLDSGRERGRIHRIAPRAVDREQPLVEPPAFKPRPTPTLSKATTAQLVALLEHRNAWHRETAARLLRERNDPAAVDAMKKLLRESKEPLGRLHAMVVLRSFGKLDRDDLLRGLNDETPELREHALRLAEELIAKDEELMKRALALAADASPRVRLAAAFALTGAQSPDVLPAMAKVLGQAGDDRVTQWAVSRVTGDQMVGFLEVVIRAGDREQVAAIARQLDERDIPAALALLKTGKVESTAIRSVLLTGLSANLARRGRDVGTTLEQHAPEQAKVMSEQWKAARIRAADSSSADAPRLVAIGDLALDNPQRSGPVLVKLVVATEPIGIQRAAATALASYPGAEVAPMLLEAAAAASPMVRAQLIEAMLARRERVAALLDAMESGSVLAASLSAEQRSRLLNASDEKHRARAAKLMSPGGGDKQKLIDAAIASTANFPGAAVNGKALFAEHCAACHKLEGVGHEIAPNLATFAQRGKEAILTNLIDPNREVNPQYLNYIVTLKDGEIVSGLIKGETASSVTVASGKGVERTVSRSDIESLRPTGKSMMPEGLEAGFTPETVADLIAYLLSQKEAKK